MDRTLRGLEILPEIEAAVLLELEGVDEIGAEEERCEAAE